MTHVRRIPACILVLLLFGHIVKNTAAAQDAIPAATRQSYEDCWKEPAYIDALLNLAQRDPSVKTLLMDSVFTGNTTLRRQAAFFALAGVDRAMAGQLIPRILSEDTAPGARESALLTAFTYDLDIESPDRLMETIVADPAAEVRLTGLRVMSHLYGAFFIEQYEALLLNPNEQVRRLALEIIGRLQRPRSLSALGRLLDDYNRRMGDGQESMELDPWAQATMILCTETIADMMGVSPYAPDRSVVPREEWLTWFDDPRKRLAFWRERLASYNIPLPSGKSSEFVTDHINQGFTVPSSETAGQQPLGDATLAFEYQLLWTLWTGTEEYDEYVDRLKAFYFRSTRHKTYLQERVRQDRMPWRRGLLIRMLRKEDPDYFVTVFLDILSTEPDPTVRRDVARAFHWMGKRSWPDFGRIARVVLRDPSPSVRDSGMLCLAQTKEKMLVPFFEKALLDESESVRSTATLFLVEDGTQGSLSAFRKALIDYRIRKVWLYPESESTYLMYVVLEYLEKVTDLHGTTRPETEADLTWWIDHLPEDAE